MENNPFKMMDILKQKCCKLEDELAISKSRIKELERIIQSQNEMNEMDDCKSICSTSSSVQYEELLFKKYCFCCKVTLTTGAFINHLKSKTHLRNSYANNLSTLVE
jgi:hypothetical protein